MRATRIGCLVLIFAAGGAHAQPSVEVATPSSLVCPVTVPHPEPASPSTSYLTTNFDFVDSDQGIFVDDPMRKVTWFFGGDAGAADTVAWFAKFGPNKGGANVIGYLDGVDYNTPASLCNHLKLVTVPGMASTSGGEVFSPDVMIAPPGDSIANYIFNVTPNAKGAPDPVLPPDSGIPGINEATTGAFLYAGTIYLFYAGSPGVQLNPDGTAGLPVTSVSYLATWASPSTVGTTADVSPTTYQIVSRVDYSLDNVTTSCPSSLPTVCPPAPPAGWQATAPTPPLGGHFIWVATELGGDGFLYMFGTGKYRASNVYLARLPLSSLGSLGHCSSPPCYLGSTPGFQIWTAAPPDGSPQAPGWSTSPPSAAEISGAAPLSFVDDPTADLGQISVRFFSTVGVTGIWLMQSTATNPAFGGKVLARWSPSPMGPWSNAIPVFDMTNDAAGVQNQKLYCCQGPWSGKLDPSGLKKWECLGPQDGAAAQQCEECTDASTTQTSGSAGRPRYGFYSPFMFPNLTNVSSMSMTQSGTSYVEDTFTVSYLLSIFEPYNSVLMNYTLRTTVAVSDFTLAVSHGSVAVAPGWSATTTATTAISGGFNSAITLSATGLPSGVTATFSPSTLAAPGSGASTLTLNAAPDAAPGTYQVALSGSGGGAAQTATFTLTVTPPVTSPGTIANKLVPIVLDLTAGNEHFTSELTFANRGTTTAAVQLTYTPSTFLGASGGGSTTLSLAPGEQLVLPDAIAFLRSQGLAIPSPSASQGGSLLVSFAGLSSPDAAFVGARTTTPSGAGRAGLAYPGVDLSAAPTGASYLYGLRSSPTDRSNLALVNAGSSPVTLRVTLFSGAAGDGRSYVLSPDTSLDPGQWTQIGHILDKAGYANGYAKVEIVSGTGPYVAYAVFNDFTTNDGSYVPLEPSSMPAEMRLLPVLVESGSFQSELVLTNPLNVPQTATLSYVESYSPAGGAGGTLTLNLQPREQKIIESAIDFLRQNHVALGPKGAATYAGALAVTFHNGTSVSSGFVGARTAAPVGGNPPGEYGLFYAGVGPSFAATFEAWVYGLEQNPSNRSNLAVANLGDAGDSITYRIDVYDGTTGQLAGSTTPTALAPGGWAQVNGILHSSGLSVANGYAHVVKLSGNSRFLLYGVVNDGGAPNQGTSDGSYVAGIPVAPITSFSVGSDIAVTYPAGLPYLTDEMMTFLPLGTSPNAFRIFAAVIGNGSGQGGPAALETTDLKTFTFASGYTSPAMISANPFSKCKATYDPEFDLNYAAPGAVWQDQTRPAGNLIMIYEAENHCPGAVFQFAYYVTVGLARSSDNGKTWPAPIDTELGGTDRYVALKGPVPEPSTPENPPIPLGCSIPSAYVDGSELYVTYNHEGPDFDGLIRVARATLGGSEPLTFSKWYRGSFSQPGIGGEDTGVLPAEGCPGYQDQAQISRYDPLGIYVMTFSCLSPSTHEAGWYYSTATSLDHQNWTAPRLIEGSLNPLTTPCSPTNDGGVFDGWYPSFVSPGAQTGHLSETGSVFFSNGCQTGTRAFTSRAFTITHSP